MQRRTSNRSSFSVSTANKNFNEANLFIQTNFTGLSDNKNDVQVDQNSFSDVNNMIVDRNNILVSRPPIKKEGDTTNIIKSWRFGTYVLYAKKHLLDSNNHVVETTDGTTAPANCKWRYTIECDSHPMILNVDPANGRYPTINYDIGASTANWNTEVTMFATAIEDKIFIWIAGELFYCLNTVGVIDSNNTKRLFFEDARKYLYVPIKNINSNGINETAESENILTDAYVDRYLYSSSVSFNSEALVGETVDVSVVTGKTSSSDNEFLYSITIGDGSQYTLIYPYSTVYTDCLYDVIETTTTNVYLRYNYTTCAMAYGYDGKLYYALPSLSNIKGKPFLSKDGKYVFAFNGTGLSTCKIMADEGADDVYLYTWVASSIGVTVDSTMVPVGYADTHNVYSLFVHGTYSSTSTYWLIQNWYDGSTYHTSRRDVSSVFGNQYYLNNAKDISIAHIAANTTYPVALIAMWIANVEDENVKNYIIASCDTTKEILSSYVSDSSENNTAKMSVAPYTVASNIYAFVLSTSKLVNGIDKEVITKIIYDKYEETRVEETIIGQTYTNGFSSVISSGGELASTPNEVFVNGSSSALFGDLDEISSHTTLVNGEIIGVEISSVASKRVIHKVNYNALTPTANTNGVSLDSSSLNYGDMVVLCPIIRNTTDYDLLSSSNKRYIVTNTDTPSKTGLIKVGDDVTFTPYGYSIQLPVGNHGNLTSGVVTITSGGAIATADDLTIYSKRYPIGVTSEGVLYNYDGSLWTSIPTTTVLGLDKYINLDGSKIPFIEPLVPTFCDSLSEYNFSIEDDENGSLIETTITKRNTDREFLLYLPKSNEQRFSDEITAIHKISDDKLAIFTNDSVWNISYITSDDGTSYQTSPIKSKLPLGCRKGSDVTLLQDGQTTAVPTERGIAAISPQDFVATTEPEITYLTESIWQTYRKFYQTSVERAALAYKITGSNEIKFYEINPFIKCRLYSYYIVFFKYMDDQMFIYDTRTSSWWIEKVQYPIRDIIAGDRLRIIVQVDYSNIYFDTTSTETFAVPKAVSNFGVKFLWQDVENEILYDKENSTFLKLTTPTNYRYTDTVLTKKVGTEVYTALRAQPVLVDGKKRVGYVNGVIDWLFSSQRLHFGVLDYYKAINSFIITEKGYKDVKVRAKLSYKVYREKSYDEKVTVRSFDIDDIRTFSCKVNTLHTTFFQYQFSNDTTEGVRPYPARFDALSIKYFVKEMIRT